MEDVDKHILVRAIGLSALGKLDKNTIKLASRLEIPHHEGVEDFVDKEAFQKISEIKQKLLFTKSDRSYISYAMY